MQEAKWLMVGGAWLRQALHGRWVWLIEMRGRLSLLSDVAVLHL